MRKSLPVLAGLAAALFVTTMAQGVFTGIKLVAKEPNPDAPNPRLLICNLFLTFDDPTDKGLAVNGLKVPLGQPQLFYRTNVTNGFHQEVSFLGGSDVAVQAGLLGVAPNMHNDTYFNIGIKSGEVTSGGVASGSGDDYSASTTAGIIINWNGGKELISDPNTGGSFVLVDINPPITDQNIAGQTPNGNQIFLAQLVIDGNRPTNDGNAPRIDVQIANVIWQNAAGVSFLTGFDPDTGLGDPLTAKHVVPAPGTLALLGLAGLAGIRRRRR